MISALNTKNIPESFPSRSSFSASLIGPAVPRGSSSSEHVIFIPYYTERGSGAAKSRWLTYLFLNSLELSLHDFRLVIDC